MKRMTYFVMALALVLGFTQCKKEQPQPQSKGVRISLNVTNGNSNGTRANVTPPSVSFVSGDQILVASNGFYVGTLTASQSGENVTFSGNITNPVEGQPLYFYFVGNKQGTLEAGTTRCTVSISDQTNELPVLSMAPSNEDYPSVGNAYSASLHNQCALVKFPLANAAGSIKIGGMKNEATIDFASSSITPTGSTGDVRLYSKSDTEKWAILLPQEAVSKAAVTIGSQDLLVDVPAIEANALLNSISTIENTSTVTDLSSVSSNTTVGDGAILTGTLGANVKISIDNNATVTLDGVSINAEGTWTSGNYAGITCEGNATIILKDGTENTVKGFYKNYPGIFAAVGHTLIIKGGAEGTGKLNASSNGEGAGAGIGGGFNNSCGNIEIQGGVITATGSEGGAGIGSCGDAFCGAITISGGTVTATGGSNAAGIGSGMEADCGAITITGGTVTATGSIYAAGIGSGYLASCGNITITNGVTQVTATKGEYAPNSIGAGEDGDCGTVTIGCTLDGDGNPVGGQTGPVTTSPLVYPTPEQTITWTSSDLEDVRLEDNETTKKPIKGITATTSSGGHWNVDSIDGTVTFSSSTYTTFKNIEITCSELEGDVPSDWSYGGGILTWTGSSSYVSMTTQWIGGISQIVFTVQ